MFQIQNRELEKNLKSCCVLQDIITTSVTRTVFHNTTPDLHNQDQDQDRVFGLRPVLS